jgi:serine protease DegQ
MKRLLSLAAFLLAAWVPLASAQLPAVAGETPVPSLAPMLKRATPAVVNIATRGTVQEQNPLMNDPFFRRFFDVPNQPRPRELQSAGSSTPRTATSSPTRTWSRTPPTSRCSCSTTAR